MILIESENHRRRQKAREKKHAASKAQVVHVANYSAQEKRDREEKATETVKKREFEIQAAREAGKQEGREHAERIFAQVEMESKAQDEKERDTKTRYIMCVD